MKKVTMVITIITVVICAFTCIVIAMAARKVNNHILHNNQNSDSPQEDGAAAITYPGSSTPSNYGGFKTHG